MRVLITTPSALGHTLPMVPLAQELQSRGHDVLWATGADAAKWVTRAGLPTVTAGLSERDARLQFRQANPQVLMMPGELLPDLVFPGMFGGVSAPAMLADLLPVVKDWKPDLVIHDGAELAGPIIAAISGVPNVTKSFGALTPPHRVAAASEVVAPLWRSFGLEPPPYAGIYQHLYLDVYPPGLQPPLPKYVGRSLALRPVAYNGDEASEGAVGAQTVDLTLARTSEGPPLVYLTMGTVFNDSAKLRHIVAALSAMPVRLLVTVGPDGDPADVGEQPSNVQVERYVAQSLVLPRCQVVISHGGSGTALQTLALGLPQLCLPQGADQFKNASAISAAGAGLALVPAKADGPAIAVAAGRLIDEPSFRERALSHSKEIAAMPGPGEVAEALELLA